MLPAFTSFQHQADAADEKVGMSTTAFRLSIQGASTKKC